MIADSYNLYLSMSIKAAADRAHGGERDDGTEMIADSYNLYLSMSIKAEIFF